MKHNTGLILVNLGSPDAPTPQSVRRYLAEFLHDKRVVETSRWIWCPVLHGIILRIRPARSARAYNKIWLSFEGKPDSEAPLVRMTRRQAKGVSERLDGKIKVDIAMRYGNPSIASVIENMMQSGVQNIAVLPLYPQYAGATTASVYDAVQHFIKINRNVPNIRILRDYHNHETYINCLKNSIDEHLGALSWQPDVILASYHGIPQAYVDKGDPYAHECEQTTRLLRQCLNVSSDFLKHTYQSRFGPKQWLRPYTDKVVEGLARTGKKSVAVFTPGFSSDCLETLEEINMEVREKFIDAGGENFTFIPCLNDRADHMDFLAKLSREKLLAGWF